MMKTIYLDGRFLNVNEQIIETFTPGVFQAQGVFETMLGLDGIVLDTGPHLKRLQQGLKILGIKPMAINPLLLKEVLRRNHLTSGRVRLMVWKAGKQTHVMIAAIAYKIPAKQQYRVGLIKTDREANDHQAELKSLDYALFADAFRKAQAQGLDEALLLNRRGHIFEASRANIFWIKDKVLYTPPLSSGCLNGITRQQVIKNARALKIIVKEEDLTPPTLKKADAAFLTNSLLGIKAIDLTMITHISRD